MQPYSRWNRSPLIANCAECVRQTGAALTAKIGCVRPTDADKSLTPGDALMLGAGGCNYCKRCAAADDKPCPFPDKAFASLEAYGIYVSQLAEAAGLKYINGQNTITYFSAILLKAE